MKKFTKMALLLLLIVASVFVFTACDDKPDVIAGGEIFIKDSGMPQLVFVQGEELDLSNGVLSVKDGDAVKEIPMNDANITVTGYDKTKLGEQTITLTYRAICLHSWIIPPEESLKGRLLPEQSYREGQYP